MRTIPAACVGGLASAVLLAAVALIWDHSHGFCAPAERVNFRLGGYVGQIPARLRPQLYGVDGRRISCAGLSDHPPELSGWILNAPGRVAADDPSRFGLMAHISLMSARAPSRRYDPTRTSEKVGPILNGRPTSYTCHWLDPDRPRSNTCRISGFGPHQEAVTLDIYQAELPANRWPALYSQVESFLNSLYRPTRG